MNENINAYITSTKNSIDTFKKTEKSQTSQKAVVTSKNKKNETVEKADKSGSIPVTNIYNINTQIEKSSEIDIHGTI